MSHVRIFDGPKGKWFRAGQLPPLSISGTLPSFVPTEAYEGRLQINNAIGDCYALLIAGTLPPGGTVTVDQDTDEIVVAWPAYSDTSGAAVIENANFESGNVGWDLGASWEIGTWNWEYDGPDNDLQAYDGTKSAELHAGFKGNSRIFMRTPAPCAPGTTITGSCQVQQGPSTAKYTGGWVVLQFLDFNGAVLATHEGNHVLSGADAEWHLSSVTATAPAGTEYARLGGEGFRKLQNKPMWLDTFAWDLEVVGAQLGTDNCCDIPITVKVIDSAGRDASSAQVIVGAEAEVAGGTFVSLTSGGWYYKEVPRSDLTNYAGTTDFSGWTPDGVTPFAGLDGGPNPAYPASTKWTTHTRMWIGRIVSGPAGRPYIVYLPGSMDDTVNAYWNGVAVFTMADGNSNGTAKTINIDPALVTGSDVLVLQGVDRTAVGHPGPGESCFMDVSVTWPAYTPDCECV